MSGNYSPKLHIRIYCSLLDEDPFPPRGTVEDYVMLSLHAQRKGMVLGDDMAFRCQSKSELMSILRIASEYHFRKAILNLLDLRWIDFETQKNEKISKKFQNNFEKFLKKFPKNLTVLIPKWLKFQTLLNRKSQKQGQKTTPELPYNIDNRDSTKLGVPNLGSAPDEINDFLGAIRTDYPQFKKHLKTAIGWARTRKEKSGYTASQIRGALTLMLDRMDRIHSPAEFHKIANGILDNPSNPELQDIQNRKAAEFNALPEEFMDGIQKAAEEANK